MGILSGGSYESWGKLNAASVDLTQETGVTSIHFTQVVWISFGVFNTAARVCNSIVAAAAFVL